MLSRQRFIAEHRFYDYASGYFHSVEDYFKGAENLCFLNFGSNVINKNIFYIFPKTFTLFQNQCLIAIRMSVLYIYISEMRM